jgi:Arc/MetJ family transcription regulator
MPERISDLGFRASNDLAPEVVNEYEILYTSRFMMRANIEIDDQLLSKAMRSSSALTKNPVVESGLRLPVKNTLADRDPQTPRQGAMGR